MRKCQTRENGSRIVALLICVSGGNESSPDAQEREIATEKRAPSLKTPSGRPVFRARNLSLSRAQHGQYKHALNARTHALPFHYSRDHLVTSRDGLRVFCVFVSRVRVEAVIIFCADSRTRRSTKVTSCSFGEPVLIDSNTGFLLGRRTFAGPDTIVRVRL